MAKKVKVPSTPMKKGVKASLKLVSAAIKNGTSAISANSKSLKKKGLTKAQKKQLSSANRKNKKTLAKAKTLLASLRGSERVANSMCPLQVQFSEFSFS